MIVLKAAVVEDEVTCLEQITYALKAWEKQSEFNGRLEVVSFKSGEEFLDTAIEEYRIIFMDIELEGSLSGVEAAKKLREMGHDTPLVFLTAYKDYALTGYKVGAIDYILKPVTAEAVGECMKRVFQSASGGCFLIRDKDSMVKIPYDKILYFESFDHYIEIITDQGRCRQIITLKKLKGILPIQFVQCHRTLLINIRRLERIDGRNATMANGVSLPISRTYLEQVRLAYIRQFT